MKGSPFLNQPYRPVIRVAHSGERRTLVLTRDVIEPCGDSILVSFSSGGFAPCKLIMSFAYGAYFQARRYLVIHEVPSLMWGRCTDAR